MTRKSAASDKPISRRVLVNITRSDPMTKTPSVVWQHEKPILEAIFGDGNVVEVDPEIMDEGYSGKPSVDMLVHNKKQDRILRPSTTVGIGFAFVGDPEAEYERLAAAYGRHAEVNQPNAEYVFGRYSTGMFARIVGTPELEDLPDEQLRQLIVSFGHDMPTFDYDSTPAERQEAQKARTDFLNLDSAALVKLAKETGVQLGG